MSNIRHYRPSEIEVIVDGTRIQSFGGFQLMETVDTDGEPVVPMDFDATMRAYDRTTEANRPEVERFAEPLDEGMSKALREIHATDMPGAEKLAAIQALQRVMICAECGGGGVVMGVHADYGVGYLDPQDCPSCTVYRDVFDPMLGVFVQKAQSRDK